MSKTLQFLRQTISQPLATIHSSQYDRLLSPKRKISPWTCPQCQRQSSATRNILWSRARSKPNLLANLRSWSSTSSQIPSPLLARNASSSSSSSPAVIPASSNGSTSSRFSSSSSSIPSPELQNAGGKVEEALPSNSSSSNPSSKLPSHEEGRRSAVSKRFTNVMDDLQSNIFIAGQRLNDLTGYSGIEALKQDIQQQETLVQTTRTAFQTAKNNHASALATRSATQREVNDLLQRKPDWTALDLDRFTTLIRSDHADERAAAAASAALLIAEREADAAAQRLAASILTRYHEEQIWSDKIRRMSTWGTWGLMGVNVLLFLLLQVAVEPWRRGRLVKGFEEKVEEALMRGRREGDNSGDEKGALIQQQGMYHGAGEAPALLSETIDAEHEVRDSDVGILKAVSEGQPVADTALDEKTGWLSAPSPKLERMSVESWVTVAQDLFSDRLVTLSQREIMSQILGSAAMGMMLAGIAGAVFRGSR